jgi:hypothetical protein
MAMGSWGEFPFGRPNSVRPARCGDRSVAVVVGVYPSAWHVAWDAPERLAGDGRLGRVAALAVDVEPTVFWDGDTDDFGTRLAAWKNDVGFVDGQHGSISPTSPSTNGSSGDKVVRHYLVPLGLNAKRVTFTDVYPVFLVKTSTGSRREQGDAICKEYDSIAAAMGRRPSSLPSRISAARLPGIAASTFGERLVADLTEAAPPLIITLGEEVWNTLLSIPPLRARPPRPTFAEMYGDAYGAVGEVSIGGRTIPWLPLVHPGLLKGTLDPAADIAQGARTVNGWATLHARWAVRPRLPCSI